jgi:hypothetical protein
MTQTPCPCCGQMREFPTGPGMWEYNETPMYYGSKWNVVNVVANDGTYKDVPVGGLVCIVEGEPIWWPSGAWRRSSFTLY